MLRVTIRAEGREQVVEHAGGPLEFGRGPARDAPRCVLTDPFASRDHLRVEILADGRLRLENLSHTSAVRLASGVEIPVGETTVASLPVRFSLGSTPVEIAAVESFETSTGTPSAARAETTPPRPATHEPLAPGIETVAQPAAMTDRAVVLHDLGVAPDAETLAHWFETLVLVQQAAATSEAFLDATARAVVELVGLDSALVLLREPEGWRIGASFPALPEGRSPFSSTVVNEVLRLRRTVFRNLGSDSLSTSLVGIDIVVAAPVLDVQHEVIGVVYGARALRPDRPPPRIAPLEALVVQVLAAAVGAGLEREQQRENAMRSQLQFEQFFSPQLARELAADPSLLEGREREVTILFTDVRNFSRISERLGAQRTFAMMQEVMELQTAHIRETEGVVVDYVGDGLLAMWNAPVDQPDHAARACSAAVALLGDLPNLSANWVGEAGEPLRLGVGIHTGPALVGNTGSHIKFKYGPMGPAVNLASRMENSTKALGVPAIVTGATRDRLPPGFGTRRLGGLRVQGFAEPIDVFELYPGQPPPEWCDHRDAFENALAHFEAGRWSEACRLLAALLTSDGDYDIPSLQLLSRSVECLRSNPESFDPSLTIQKLT